MKNKLLWSILALGCVWSSSALNPVIQVTGGSIRGVASDADGVTIYKGIPYAAPPVGALRWKAPQPVIPWQGIKLMDAFGRAAMQPFHDHEHRSEVKNFGDVDYVKEFYEAGDPQYSEDCLYLNVWQPTEAKAGDKLPVAFWIHGGAYAWGFGYESEFNGDAFAQKGVIMVSINYRLGILGFLGHPALSAENSDHLSGNYGMLDQIAALQWVRDNIARFGGDPDNITIFGQSAGAMSVRHLLCSPMTKGMIARAIIQSGGGIDTANTAMATNTQTHNDALGEKIFPGKSAEELRALSYEEIQAAFAKYCADNKTYFMFSPVIDGHVLSCDLAQGIRDKSIPNIPYMIGCTLDDITFAKLSTQLTDFSLEIAKRGYKPAYIYQFARRLPGNGSGAFHSSELWYMFGTLKNCWRPMTAADYKLSEEMVGYWTNFMKQGDPNGVGLPTWKPCTTGLSEVMKLDTK